MESMNVKRPEKRMRKDIEHHKEHGQTKLLKKVSKVRKASLRREPDEPRLDEKNWEERADDLPSRSRRSRRPTLDELVRELEGPDEKKPEESPDAAPTDVGL